MTLRRSAFLALATAAIAAPAHVRAQSDADPATTSSTPSLRVLLGRGSADPASQPGSFTFNGKPYRGEFVHLDDGGVVNVVDVEQYLYSVVPREMPPGWPAAALQAQAVCARTYVLQRSNPRRQYDLVPSELDQVYLGMAGESESGRAAVDATAATVLRFGAGYASVAYSSCCGGHTEASSDAWGGTPIAYLAGVICEYCTASPNYRWSSRFSLGDVEQRFATEIAPFGSLHDVRITATDESGRARSFELLADRGSATVRGSAFRLGIGARVVRSLLVSGLHVDQPSGSVEMEGGGLGHGVGMCQWGARGMALAGRSARDILSLYFPGTTLGT